MPAQLRKIKDLRAACGLDLMKVGPGPFPWLFRMQVQKVAKTLMTIHKRILEWQARHPIITWAFWGIVWAVVLVILFRPQTLN